jgi:hypothetical protein
VEVLGAGRLLCERAGGRYRRQARAVHLCCCVEKKAPYAVSVLAADQEMIEQGWRQALRELDVLATCKKANSWPGYSDQIETVSLPPWMRPKADGSLPTPTEIETY